MPLSNNTRWAGRLREILSLTTICTPDLDHHSCNEPECEQRVRQCRESGSQSAFRLGSWYYNSSWHRLMSFYSSSETLLYVSFHKSYALLIVHPVRNAHTPIRRNAFNMPHELRGRPVARTSLSITAVSAENSPPLSKYIPFFLPVDIRRVLSPTSWFKCNGKCSLPTESDVERAHVVSDESRTMVYLTAGCRSLCQPVRITSQPLTMLTKER